MLVRRREPFQYPYSLCINAFRFVITGVSNNAFCIIDSSFSVGGGGKYKHSSIIAKRSWQQIEDI